MKKDFKTLCGKHAPDNGGIGFFFVLAAFAILYSLSFIYEQTWFLAWFALAPLSFKSLKSSRRVFGSLFCFFFVFYVCVYSWLISMYPLDFAGLGNFESVIVIAAGLVLIPLVHATEMSLSIWTFNRLGKVFEKAYAARCVLMSMGYVFGEFLQSLGKLAFPWARVYISQVGRIENLQSAKLFGSYFISFAVVFVNFLIGAAFVNAKKAKSYVLAAVAVFAINYAFGSGCIFLTEKSYSDDNTVTAVALQGNISSYDKWSSLENSYDAYKTLAARASAYCEKQNIKADVAVLPETAFPEAALITVDGKNVKTASKGLQTAKQTANELSCPVAVGVFALEDGREYNALAAVNEDGIVIDKYLKKHLVPFGEFVPYRNLLNACIPLLSEINMLSEDLSSGNGDEPISLGDFKAAAQICYDSVFSADCASQVKKGGEIILVSTNDSWYKTSFALKQHAAHSVMRAIENHRPLVRSANTGISLMIEPTGKIIASSEINQSEFLVSTLHKSKITTLYTKIGDLTLFACFAMIFCLALVNIKNLVKSISEKKRKNKKEQP